MKEFCYVLIRMEAMKCFARILAGTLDAHGSTRWDEAALHRLLREGWRPVREISLGNGQALILLEMDITPGEEP